MNSAHIHLLLNHIPVIAFPVIFLLLLYGVVKKSDELKKAGLIAFALVALTSVPSYLSGEPAEHLVENAPGVTENYIGQHEDAAMMALIGSSLLGILSFTAIFLFRLQKQWHAALMSSIVVLALLTTGLMAWTANLGGKIRHTEIRSGSLTPTQDAGSEKNNEKDDD